MNRTRTEPATSTGDDPGRSPRGLRELEQAASDLNGGGDVEAFRAAQRELWLGLHERGDPWLITDFVSLGSPMYFAEQLYTKNRRQFDERVDRRELPTCPPRPEPARGNNINKTRLWYSWNNGGVRDLYHGAPFAVVRWTNLWFPSRFGFLGDWFGGPLGPLSGRGIKDVAMVGNRPGRLIPAYAHALYTGLASPATGPGGAQALISSARNVLQSDFAKACHHGSADFSGTFLAAVNPIATVVSSGDEESFAHPRPDALGAYGRAGRGARPLIFSTELSRSSAERIKFPNRTFEPGPDGLRYTGREEAGSRGGPG